MLNIQIDSPELEESIKQTCGDDPQSIAKVFLAFVRQQQIKQDIGISIQQLQNGEGIPLDEVVKDIQTRYE